ncbi:MAG TPA: DUF2284 domain-containing protein [Candidatus Limiplasma pullicola]|nr:DUF2284 domain-containing protein [Candidatus Limiplasma pullicola]
MSELGMCLIKAALTSGAAKAAIIPQRQIVLSAEFRRICETNGCGNYGRCWMCPPDTGDIETAMAQVRRYPWALIYQTIASIEDSFDIEGMTSRAREHAQVSLHVQQAVKPLLQKPFLHLGCGGCRLCETCARRDGQPCRHPDKALASLEGSGVDVYNTTKGTSLKYINGQNTVTFFGMVLWEA